MLLHYGIHRRSLRAMRHWIHQGGTVLRARGQSKGGVLVPPFACCDLLLLPSSSQFYLPNSRSLSPPCSLTLVLLAPVRSPGQSYSWDAPPQSPSSSWPSPSSWQFASGAANHPESIPYRETRKTALMSRLISWFSCLSLRSHSALECLFWSIPTLLASYLLAFLQFLPNIVHISITLLCIYHPIPSNPLHLLLPFSSPTGNFLSSSATLSLSFLSTLRHLL